MGRRKEVDCASWRAVETVEIGISVILATRPEWRARYRDKETGQG